MSTTPGARWTIVRAPEIAETNRCDSVNIRKTLQGVLLDQMTSPFRMRYMSLQLNRTRHSQLHSPHTLDSRKIDSMIFTKRKWDLPDEESEQVLRKTVTFLRADSNCPQKLYNEQTLTSSCSLPKLVKMQIPLRFSFRSSRA